MQTDIILSSARQEVLHVEDAYPRLCVEEIRCVREDSCLLIDSCQPPWMTVTCQRTDALVWGRLWYETSV